MLSVYMVEEKHENNFSVNYKAETLLLPYPIQNLDKARKNYVSV